MQFSITRTYYFGIIASNISHMTTLSNIQINNVLGLNGPQLSPITPSPIMDGKVYLNWTAVAWATYYNVYWETSAFDDFDLYAMSPKALTLVNEASFQFIALNTYYFGIIASNGSHSTSLSNIESADVVDLVNLQLSTITPHNVTNGKVNLNWTEVSWATFYLVYRANSLFDNYDLPGMSYVSNVTTNYTVDQVFSIGIYYYGIIASNGTHSTSLSNIDNVNVLGLTGNSFNITPYIYIPLFVPDALNPSVFMNISSNVSLAINITVLTTVPVETPENGLIYIQIQVNRSDYEVNATFRIYYNVSSLPAGIEEDELDIYNWNGSSWVGLGAILNSTGHYLEYALGHFSFYAIIGEQTDVGPPVGGLPLEIIILIAIIVGAIAGVGIAAYVVVRRRGASKEKKVRVTPTKLRAPKMKPVDIGKTNISEAKSLFSKPSITLEEKLRILIANDIPLSNVPELKDTELNQYLYQDLMILPNEFIEILMKLDATIEEKLEIIEEFKNIPKEFQQDFLKEFRGSKCK